MDETFSEFKAEDFRITDFNAISFQFNIQKLMQGA